MGVNFPLLLTISCVAILGRWCIAAHSFRHHTTIRSWSVRTSHHKDNFLVQLLNYPSSPGMHTLTIQNLDMGCKSGLEPSVKSNFTTSSVALALIDKYLGPDELLIDIQGKTLQSFIPQYHSCGNYSQTFHITLEGVYHLTLLRLRSQYVAINELVLEFPHVETEYLVSEWMEFKGTGRKDPVCGEEGGFAGYWQATAKNQALQSGIFDKLDLAQQTTPFTTIRREKNFDNIVVPMLNDFHLQSFVNISSHSSETHCADVVDEYEWIRGSCPWQEYHADDKDRNAYEVTISGDSHLQRLSMRLNEYLGKVVNVFTDDSSLCKTLPQRNADKIANTWLFANCGHHPAAYNHYSIARYIETIVNFVRMLRQENYSDKNFVWIESNPLPIRQDHFVIDMKDWRSLHRVKLFNIIAEDILRASGFSNILRTFQMQLPFAHEACDVAHYVADHAYDPIIQQLLQFYHTKLK